MTTHTIVSAPATRPFQTYNNTKRLYFHEKETPMTSGIKPNLPVNNRSQLPAAHETDPEIANMSRDEIIAASKALYGAWADRKEEIDNFFDGMKRASWDRLDRLNEPGSKDHPV